AEPEERPRGERPPTKPEPAASRPAPEAKAPEPKAQTKPAESVAAPAAEVEHPGRPIIPVHATLAQLLQGWEGRRRALREQDPARAHALEAEILAAQRELAIENLVPFSAALVRESDRARQAHAPMDAVARAELAVQLAPDLPAAH